MRPVTKSSFPAAGAGAARWRWYALWVAVGVIAGVLAAFVVIDAATTHYALANADFSHLGDVVGRFLLSPGFGGAAAVLAATLAYRAAVKTRADARAQVDADRRNALDDRDDDRWWETYDRWWEMYRMVYADAPGLGQKGVTLALEALEKMAHTEDQDTMLVVLAERLRPTDDAIAEDER